MPAGISRDESRHRAGLIHQKQIRLSAAAEHDEDAHRISADKDDSMDGLSVRKGRRSRELETMFWKNSPRSQSAPL